MASRGQCHHDVPLRAGCSRPSIITKCLKKLLWIPYWLALHICLFNPQQLPWYSLFYMRETVVQRIQET